MHHTKRTFVAVCLLAAGLAACSSQQAPPAAEKKDLPAPVASTAAPAPATPPGGGQITGKVLETMDAGGYTYVQVDDGVNKIWAAGPQAQVAKGDKVTLPQGMPMKNYHSASLNRDFDVVYFVEYIQRGDGPAPMAKAPAPAAGGTAETPKLPEGMHPTMDAAQSAKEAGVNFKDLKKAGQTVAEVFAGQKALAGKEVAVRGKVVKFNAQIMGRNWIHLQDGTGTDGTNDLTITTSDLAKVGDTVLAKGKVVLDRDFGMGYKYAVLVEEAKVTVE
jgi:hypothetical protein